MASLATVYDLQEQWPPAISSTQQARVLLDRASAIVRAEWPDIDSRIETGEMSAGLVTYVVCAMVKRAMLGDMNDGQSQAADTSTMGPFSTTASRTFANPEGALFLTRQERVWLSGMTVTAVSMTCEGL